MRFQKIAWSALIALSLILLNLPPPTAARLKAVVGQCFVPLFGIRHALEQASGRVVDTTLPRSQLLHELAALQSTNQALRQELQQLRGVAEENARLRGQLALTQRPQGRWKLARVIGRDPAQWWLTVQIDVGSRDGVAADHPVWTPEGLVGRVQWVGPRRSQVVLVGDSACRVSVKVRDTGEHGVLTAAPFTAFDFRQVSLQMLPSDTRAAPGHLVVTSGLSEIFPAEIPVGTIVEVARADGAVHTNARVKLAVDSAKLSEVWVAMPTR